MPSTRIAFIGAGNMALSLISGLIDDGWPHDQIYIADPDATRREQILARFPVHSSANNCEAAQYGDIIVLAVKPQLMKTVTLEIAPAVQQNHPLVVSIAAGIRIEALERWLVHPTPIVRCMPNTPALVRSAATVLFASSQVNEMQRNQAESLLRAVGLTLWIDDESLLDAVTALSGSGPAYFFLVIEALSAAGEKMGLPEPIARLLSIETAVGAAKMALESLEPPEVLRQRVTSPGGTTERALQVLEDGHLRELFVTALRGAQQRAQELADQLGA